MRLFTGLHMASTDRAAPPHTLHGLRIGQFTLADAAPIIWFIMLVGLLSVLGLGSMSMIEGAGRAHHGLTFPRH